jgi:CheY-like chemotaxis protein
LLELALVELGYEVLCARDTAEAFNAIVRKAPDVIILDYFMDGITGDQAASQLKQLVPNTPIILFSGSFPTVQPSFTGIDAFVRKEAGLGKLVSTLESLLTEHTHYARRFVRRPVRLQMGITTERSGGLLQMKGVSKDIAEGGIAGTSEGSLVTGETVLLTLSDARLGVSLQPRAQVRHRTGTVYGFEFISLTPEMRGEIQSFCLYLAHI